jgi:hypothetical protein
MKIHTGKANHINSIVFFSNCLVVEVGVISNLSNFDWAVKLPIFVFPQCEYTARFESFI